MKKILLVEDHETTVRDLKRNLERNGYTVHVTGFAQDAPDMIAQLQIDLVLLDLILPDSQGLGFGSKLRKSFPDLPIIVVSRITDSDEKVKAFQLYADDYVPKPYHINELLERIRVQFDHIERRHPGNIPRIITVGPLEVNLKQRQVKVHGQAIELAKKEYELLELFVRHEGSLLTYDDLLAEIWRDESESQRRYIHVYVNKLRKKIEMPAGCRFIHNESKIGYRFQLME